MTRRVSPALVAVLASVVLTAGIVVAVSRWGSHTGPPHPKEWDPRVLDLVAFDERHRGLEFEQPVFIDFFTAEEYSDSIRGDEAELTDEDRKDLENSEGELRALGLVQGDVDLFGAGNELVDTGTLAFYDPRTERISVRGTEMTVDLKVTLVHELVHVLQDQHFGIGTKRTSTFETSQQAGAFRAVLEGDATRIEDQFVESLAQTDRTTYDAAHQADIDTATEGLSAVPAALQAFQASPYVFGPPYVMTLAADGGQDAVDGALKAPPSTEEQLVDVARAEPALDVDDSVLQVDEPTDAGDLGWITWYLFLAERIDPQVALRAADGWGGDAYVAFTQDGRTCMNIAWQGDTATDDQEMRDALDSWIAAMPPGPSVAQNGDLLVLHTCDPTDAEGFTVANRALDTIQLPSVRSALVLDLVQSSQFPLDEAFDAAACVTMSLPFDEIVAVNKGEKGPEDLRTAIAAAAPRCVNG